MIGYCHFGYFSWLQLINDDDDDLIDLIYLPIKNVCVCDDDDAPCILIPSRSSTNKHTHTHVYRQINSTCKTISLSSIFWT